MTERTDTKWAKWQKVLEQQQIANATRWLTTLENQADPTNTVIKEYDNLLRALETSLQRDGAFDLAYQLIEQLFTIVFGYADWDRWLVYLDQAINLSQQIDRNYERAKLLSYKGDIYSYKGEYAKAKDFQQASLEQYKTLSDMVNYAITLTKIANVAHLQGNVSESLELLQEARQVSNATNDNLTLVMVEMSLSSTYYRIREWSLGLTAAQSAYQLAKKLGKQQIETQALLNIIAFQTQQGNWIEVNALANKLEETLKASGDLVRLGQLKNTQGIAAYNQGLYLEAEKAWQEALQINSQINQPGELAHLYNNLGMVYTKLNQLNTAEKMLKHAADIYDENLNVFNWANTLDNLADVYELQGDLARVKNTLESAATKLGEDKSKPHVGELLVSIEKRLRAVHTDK